MLIVVPTRELAQQIKTVVMAIGDYMQVSCYACIGGTSLGEDIRRLQQGIHVIVGTPGRIFDMLRRKVLSSKHIKMFVLDEADEMLSRGFKHQIMDIFLLLPSSL